MKQMLYKQLSQSDDISITNADKESAIVIIKVKERTTCIKLTDNLKTKNSTKRYQMTYLILIEIIS